MNARPIKVELAQPDELRIEWSDGAMLRYPVAELRLRCPCATCREKRQEKQAETLLPVLSLAETMPMRIQAMRPIGNYAYGIEFSDGHDTGIFTLEFLRAFANQDVEG
jgi:DUF971 family protein